MKTALPMPDRQTSSDNSNQQKHSQNNPQIDRSNSSQVNHSQPEINDDTAFADLAAILEPEFLESDTTPFSTESPLLMAIGLVTRAAGIPLTAMRQPEDSIEAIAQANRFRIRRVRLAGDWWRSDQGALLGYWHDGQPIVLLPHSQGYVLTNPAMRQRMQVTARVAAEITPEAVLLYRPLPAVISFHSLRLFLAQGLRPDLLRLICLGGFGTGLGMATAPLIAVLINAVIPGSDRDSLQQMGLILLAVAIGQFMLQIGQNLATLRVEGLIQRVLPPAIWDRLLRLSPAFFRQYTVGDLVRRVLTVQQIQQKLSDTTQRTILSGVFALLNLGLMLFYSSFLALLAIAIALISIAASLLASKTVVRLLRRQQQIEGDSYGLAVQLISSVAKLRIAAAENRAFAVWAGQHRDRLRLKASVQHIIDRLTLLNEVLPVAATILLFAWASPVLESAASSPHLPISPSLNLGQFLAFYLAFGLFLRGAIDLSNTLIDLCSIIPIWERVQPILQTPIETDTTRANPGPLSGGLQLDRVSFRYPDSGLVLQDVSLQAAPGEFVAIVGASGSGKSTLLRLLLGFETPLQGRVLYDGKDLSRLDVEAVRRQLGVVLQNSQLSSGSIFEAIAGGTIVTQAQAWTAAQLAGIAEDIAQMPMGMHTQISEGGSNLSGGQRQRLLIARALVTQPKILLLDEATSALDNHTQAIVTQSLKQLSVTRIAIAHRLSTIQAADWIYVLEAGQIVQVGTFAELMQQEGVFVRLAARQLG